MADLRLQYAVDADVRQSVVRADILRFAARRAECCLERQLFRFAVVSAQERGWLPQGRQKSPVTGRLDRIQNRVCRVIPMNPRCRVVGGTNTGKRAQELRGSLRRTGTDAPVLQTGCKQERQPKPSIWWKNANQALYRVLIKLIKMTSPVR